MNIKTEDNCSKQFERLKFEKCHKYISYKIHNEVITIDAIGEKQESWSSFLEKLPPNQFRYCVFDFHFKNADNMSKQKLIFINWNPASAPMKTRVLYATAKQNFKKYLNLNTRDFIVQSKQDLTQQDLIKELSK